MKRSVGKAGLWWDDELAVTIAVKPPSVVQETLGMMEEHKGEFWEVLASKPIKSNGWVLARGWQARLKGLCVCGFHMYRFPYLSPTLPGLHEQLLLPILWMKVTLLCPVNRPHAVSIVAEPFWPCSLLAPLYGLYT